MNITEVINPLTLTVETRLGDLFFSVGEISESTSIRRLCNDISFIANLLVEQSQTQQLIEINEKNCFKFLTKILPSIIEILLKRSSKRFVLYFVQI